MAADDTGGQPNAALDVLVVGSGVAGLSAAVRLAHVSRLRVGVVTKGALSDSTTRWAQGGVAAVLGGQDEDSVDLHHADTLAAGAGLCDVDAVRVLVSEGPRRVHQLIALGAEFDRDQAGVLELAREGGHSTARVVHAGGAATGAEVERALVAAVRGAAAVVLERWFAVDLVVDGDRCTGVVALDPSGTRRVVAARHVVLAAGGVGQLYAVTTNPAEATGDGLAMALRQGVPVADVEFVQFHPTALHHPAMPRPLLSEALRGHGALLRDANGDRFVDELAPRDVVSRAMAHRMREQGVEHLWLDATALTSFATRFPTLAASLGEAGLDPAVDWLPIAPAAHHIAGGVLTDLDGATALPGLWAIGEVACSGVHGANRLASNSLLEGMVFGARAAEALAAGKDGPDATGALAPLLAPLLAAPGPPAAVAGGGPGATGGGPGGDVVGAVGDRLAEGSAGAVPPRPLIGGDGTGDDGAALPVWSVAAAGPSWARVARPEAAEPPDLADRRPDAGRRGADVRRDPPGLGRSAVRPAAGSALAETASGRGAALDVVKARAALQRAMTDGAGVVRDEASLVFAARTVVAVARALGAEGGAEAGAVAGYGGAGVGGARSGAAGSAVAAAELDNLVTVAWAVVRSALVRTETRGAHTRQEWPTTDPAWRGRLGHGIPAPPGMRSQRVPGRGSEEDRW
jgi:L-aspartate oxidase